MNELNMSMTVKEMYFITLALPAGWPLKCLLLEGNVEMNTLVKIDHKWQSVCVNNYDFVTNDNRLAKRTFLQPNKCLASLHMIA